MSEAIAQEIGLTLARDVLGLSFRVDATDYVSYLTCKFKCPCGEISGLGYAVASEPTNGLRKFHVVGLVVEQLKQELRDRVRGEGNEPNF